MIIRCPSCSARRDIPNIASGSGATLVACPSCGHDWLEGSAVDGSAKPTSPEEAIVQPASELLRLIDAAKTARKEFDTLRRRRLLHTGAWGGLALFAICPAIWVFAFPEEVVSAFPASMALYEQLDREVNIYGVEIRQIDLQHLLVDGKNIIAVKGELKNVSSTTRKIPWLRFGLKAKDSGELYHWTLDTEARPLKPGETTTFVTRLAAPPESANNVEIRFARADEIGSNAIP
ncbi:zinc-ribbon domain-containing protein [Aestuariivirga sp.]|uniref:zinc-ribbon domain-containing protein n=1 Tax=Aestuariivirga sp. TaxID=2650926 RepID=UPI003BAB1670